MNDLYGLTKELLTKYGIWAKKSFGQNFLTDSNILNNIVTSLDMEGIEEIVEIGPGLGFLTEKLLSLGKPVTVIEADRDMVTILKDRFAERITIIEGDCLKVDFNLFHVKQTLFIGNLPYNITKSIVTKLAQLESPCAFSFMVQKEVGDKLIFEEGKLTNSPLGTYLGLRGRFYSVIDVPHSSFSPAPKVESVFMNFKGVTNYDFKGYDVLKKIYSRPNKTIANNLRNYNLECGGEVVTYASKRVHQLTLSDFDILVSHFLK